MEYLLKASAIIFIFYCSYKLFLHRETFFQTNRWFLLLGIIVATLLPLIVIPIYVEFTPIALENINSLETNMVVTQIANESSLDLWQIGYYTYVIGVIFFLGKLCVELTSLKFLFNKHEYYKHESFTLIETTDNIPPFSFFNWIVYNPNNYSKSELNHILNHEKVHAKELHSIDIVLTQLACVMLWFNPFIWLYKKEIQQNLEFIADKKAQDFSECEKSYQLVLLKSSVPQHKFLMTNNFYNSQIKKRIIMLHKSKSNKLNAWKYGLILPVLALFLMSFNTENVYIEIDDLPENSEHLIQSETSNPLNEFSEDTSIEEKTEPIKTASVNKPNKNTKNLAIASPKKSKKNSQIEGDISITLITKETTDIELDKIKTKLKKEGLIVKFKGVKRNKSGEITAIKIEAKSKKSNGSYTINSDETIEPIKIVFDEENSSISIGNGHSAHGDNMFVYSTEGGNHQIHKSGNGSHVYVISEDEHNHDEEHSHDEEHEHEHDAKFIIKSNGKKGKVKRIKRSKNVQVISGDNDNVVEVIVEGDNDGNDTETIIINGKKVNIDEDSDRIIVKGKVKNVWVSDDGNEEDVIIIENSGNNIFISDNGKNPLFIVDGKEVSKDVIAELKPDSIESMTVLKGKKAKEKYGDKGKDGVIIVKTKKN